MTWANGIYDYSLSKADGTKLELSQYKGQALLLVNIATKCGYTGQLGPLEDLYEKYKNKGFTVIGIPSNEFMGQTPEGNTEVIKFCKRKYGTTFPIVAKHKVKDTSGNPLYKYLTSQTGNKTIEWNFTKFLIDKKGKIHSRFSPSTDPMSDELTKAINKVLN
jgi:glutathione peroxidase